MAELETRWLVSGAVEHLTLDGERSLEGAECACVVRPLGKGWEVLDRGQREAVHLNGARLRQSTLEHGDTLWLWDRLVRFIDAPQLKDDGFATLVDGTPENEGRIEVWADALLEHGDPLGRAIAERGEAALFEGLGAHLMAGHLDVKWRHGLPREVVLRMLPVGFWPEAVLAQLLALRATRWLEAVVYDGNGARPPERIERPLLRLLLGARLPPTLRRFSCGYTRARAEDDAELRALRARLPGGLTWEPPTLATSAWLEVVATRAHASRPLRVGTRCDVSRGVVVGTAPDDSLDLSGGRVRFIRFEVNASPVGWFITPGAQATRLNGRVLSAGFAQSGRALASHRLLHGDIIESAPWAFRFVARGT